MENATSNEIAADPARRRPTPACSRPRRRARSLGFEVAIKPHVDVLDGTFRGEIQPARPEAWFASYVPIVEKYAVARPGGRASTFVIGTELTSMSADDAPGAN